MDKDSCIWVAGHKGLVGSSIIRRLNWFGYKNIVTTDWRLDKEFDKLFDQKIDYVFLCAAKVGGIGANNTYPADFIYSNLKIQTNVIDWCYKNSIKKFLFLGSSCIYPRDCEQPIKEEYLMTGPLEKTNSAYAISKIAGIEMCKSYYKQHGLKSIIAMPCNLYGPGDRFDLDNGHVLPTMISKFHNAKVNNLPEVVLWGDGSPYREFLYVDDLADACIYLMRVCEHNDIINIGAGEDLTIKELAKTIARIVKYDGNIVWDITKPNGTPRKLLDTSFINSFGWYPKTNLSEGMKKTYDWYLTRE